MAARALSPTPEAIADLYEADFHAWTVQQAALLRSGDLDRVDLANIAEEVETLGRSERAALRSAYRLVALHLLKLIVQRERVSRSWLGTIARERAHVASILEDNPSLKPQRDELFRAAYRDARKEVAAETGLPLSASPVEPPFTLDEVENEAFLPNAPGQ